MNSKFYLLVSATTAGFLSLFLGRALPDITCNVEQEMGQISVTPAVSRTLPQNLRQILALYAAGATAVAALAEKRNYAPTKAALDPELPVQSEAPAIAPSQSKPVSFNQTPEREPEPVSAVRVRESAPSLPRVPDATAVAPTPPRSPEPSPADAPLSEKEMQEALRRQFGDPLYKVTTLKRSTAVVAQSGTSKSTTLNAYFHAKMATEPGTRFLIFSMKPDSYQGLDGVAWEFREIGETIPATTWATDFRDEEVPAKLLEFLTTVKRISDERCKRYSESQRAHLPSLIAIVDDATPLTKLIEVAGAKVVKAIQAVALHLIHVGRSSGVFYWQIVHSFNYEDLLGIPNAKNRDGLDLVTLGLETFRVKNAVGEWMKEGGYNSLKVNLAFADRYSATAASEIGPQIEPLIARSREENRAVMIVLAANVQTVGLLNDYRPMLKKRRVDWSKSGAVPRDRAFAKAEVTAADADEIDRVQRQIDSRTSQVVPIDRAQKQSPPLPPPAAKPIAEMSEERFRELFPGDEPEEAYRRLLPYIRDSRIGQGIREALKCGKNDGGNRDYKSVGWPAAKFLMRRYGREDPDVRRHLEAGLRRSRAAGK